MADTSTVVGETILVNGNLSGDEDLLVLGRVEGTITLTKTLHVQESGIVKANVQVRNAVISGVVVGNISASDSVEITEQGRMVGDIRAPRIIIVEGASFRGHVDMGDEGQRPSGPLPARQEVRSTLGRTTVRPALGAASAFPARAKAPEPARAPMPAQKAPMPPPPRAATQPAKPSMPPPKPPQAVVAAGGKKKVVVKK